MASNNVPNDATPLGEAKQWVQDRLEKGVSCPCCSQHAKVYRRNINYTIAAVLILLARRAKENQTEQWLHVEKHIMNTGVFKVMPREWQKLRYWDLMEPNDLPAEDGNPHNGYWRIPDTGMQFAEGKIKVPKYVWVFNNIVIAKSNKFMVDVHDCLKNKFNYSELMGLPT